MHCERQVEEVVQQKSSTSRLIQGELMTDAYFDGIAAEIRDLLQVHIACSVKIIPAGCSELKAGI